MRGAILRRRYSVCGEVAPNCPPGSATGLAQLWNKISTSLYSNNNLFQNIDWEFLDVPLDGVVSRKTIANSLAAAPFHIILAIFTAAGLTNLSFDV